MDTLFPYSTLFQNKKLRGVQKVGLRLLDGFALGGSASLGIDGNETAFFGGDQDGGELHGAASRRKVIVPLVHEGWDGEKLAASAAPTTACALQERRKPRAFRRRRSGRRNSDDPELPALVPQAADERGRA